MMVLLTYLTLIVTPQRPEIKQPQTWQVAAHQETGGRLLLVKDPILLQVAKNSNFTPKWKETATANEDGYVNHNFFRDGWAYCEYESEQSQTVFLQGQSFHSIFVNGDRFFGDFYSAGLLHLAIPLKKGKNRFLVRVVRGAFKLKLIRTEETCSISPRDMLFPDLRQDTLIDSYGAVVVLNHTDRVLKNVKLEFGGNGVFKKTEIELNPLLPYALAKPAFQMKQLRQPKENELNNTGQYSLVITLLHQDGSDNNSVTAVSPALPIRKKGQQYRATKKSGIDGSTQYFAVVPPRNFDPKKSYALYLSLHGAAVEATGQAACYQAKPDAFCIAPTNRRPYGFDWQEWGRADALETLDLAISQHQIDPRRIYLTGHSMGGHGTWYIGALYPSKFAALGPAAGWITFASYRDIIYGEIDLSNTPFASSDLENDVFGMIENYTHLPIYILHGEKDNNVPATESHKIVAKLEKFHQNFIYHEQPNAGHWFGNESVDWQPMIEFFRRHTNPISPLSIRFKTPNPSISSTYAWATIHSQITPEELSNIQADAYPRRGQITIKTENIARLQLNLKDIMPQKEVTLAIDNTEITIQKDLQTNLVRTTERQWILTGNPDWSLKGAHRNGPFKQAFDKNMVWVYGTNGSDKENRALIAKIRYDQQVWWYRGNGNVQIVSDKDFNLERFPNQNIILYGHADINSAFDQLLTTSPIQVKHNIIKFGQLQYEGDYGVFFTYPRFDTDENLVGVIGMTTENMIRASQQARYFISGVSCPDYAIFGIDVLTEGFSSVVEAGYFNSNWELPY